MIQLPYTFLEGGSSAEKITAFATKRIEPIFDGVSHYANKVIFGIQGEYLIPIGTTYSLTSLLNTFTTFTNQNCTLTNISIQESNFLGVIPYEVECECYSFTEGNSNKIISASNETNIAENIDGTITISRNINVGAVSVNNSNPVQDAKTFAQLLTGKTTNWSLNFPQGTNKTIQSANVILNSSSESADIFNGTYSIQQNFTSNVSQQDLTKKGIIKNSIEIQSGIDGLSTINHKCTVVGGLGSIESDLANVAKGEIQSFQLGLQPNQYSVLSNSSNYDDISKTFEVATILTNDKTITTNGNKVSNTLTCNYDFFNSTYTANFTSEVKPATTIVAGNLVKDLTKINDSKILTFFGLQGYILELSVTGTGNNSANYSASFISSPSIYANGNKIEMYDLSLNVDYQPGYPKNTFTPILSGQGKYYLENLDFINNSTININLNGKFVDKTNPPQIQNLVTMLKSGEDLVQNTRFPLLLKDQIAINHNNLRFNYVKEIVAEDDTFKDIT